MNGRMEGGGERGRKGGRGRGREGGTEGRREGGMEGGMEGGREGGRERRGGEGGGVNDGQDIVSFPPTRVPTKENGATAKTPLTHKKKQVRTTHRPRHSYILSPAEAKHEAFDPYERFFLVNGKRWRVPGMWIFHYFARRRKRTISIKTAQVSARPTSVGPS